MMKFNSVIQTAMLVAIAGLGLTARAANYTWDSDPATTGAQDGPGTWSTAANNWWSGATNSVWLNGSADAAIFGAANGAAGAVTLANGLVAGSLTFNPAGSGTYSLSGGSLILYGNITNTASAYLSSGITVSNTTIWRIASGETLTLGGYVTNTPTAGGDSTGYYQVTLNNTGTAYFSNAVARLLNLAVTTNGTVILDGSSYQSLSAKAGWGLWLQSSGALLVATNNASLNINRGFQIQQGEARVYSGSVIATNSTAANSVIYVGNSANPATLSLYGGTVITRSFSMASSAGSATLNLQGGTLALQNSPSSGGGAGTRTMNMGGGTLRADAGGLAVPSALPFTLTGINGNFKVDSQANTLTFSNTLAGAGGLTKLGTGILVLAAGCAYAGTTLVSNGVVQVAGALGGGGTVTVASGGTLSLLAGSTCSDAVTVSGTLNGEGVNLSSTTVNSGGTVAAGSAGAGQLTHSNLTLNAGATASFVAGASSDVVTAANGFTIGGPVTVQILSSPTLGAPLTGTYDLIFYEGSIGGNGFGGFTLGSLPSGVSGYLQDNTGVSVQLVVTSSLGQPMTWKGNVLSTWSLGTNQDWLGNISGLPTRYWDNVPVTFDDSAASFNVSLVTNVNPLSITVGASASYLLSGSGSFATPNLTLNGPGTLTLANGGTNTVLGSVAVNGGTFQLGNGGTAGALNGDITDNASVVFNRADDTLFGGAITGFGTLVKAGAGALTLTSSNAYYYGTTVSAGTLQFTSSRGLGTGGVTLTDANTGTNDVALLGMTVPTGTAGRYILANNITVAADGSGKVTIGSSTPAPFVANSGVWFAGNLTLNRDVTFLANNGDLYLGNYPTSGSLTGTNNVTFAGNSRVIANPTNCQNFSGDAFVAGGALLQLYSGTFGATRNIDLAPGAGLAVNICAYVGRLTGSGNVGQIATSTLSNNTLVVGNGDASSAFAGTIGAGTNGGYALSANLNLTKVGLGTFTFNGVGTYTRSTVITQGVLVLGATAVLTNTPSIDVQTGALLDVSANSGFTLATNQTLLGNGSVAGNLTVGNGATLAPGESGIGTLVFSNALTLAAGSLTQFELNKDTATNDFANVTGHLTYGGTLSVANLGSTALALGDTFKLFNAATYGGAFTSFLPASPGTNLAWDASFLTIDGTLRIKTAISTTQTNLSVQVTGSSLMFWWPPDHTGWHLQTNAVSLVDTNAWFNWPGSDTTNELTITLDPTKTNVFFRLVYP